MVLNENCIYHDECVERLGLTIAVTMLCQTCGRYFQGFIPDCDNCNMFIEKEETDGYRNNK